MKKIYIAGPEYGFEGLYPLDNVVDFSQEKHKIAKDIFEANVKMIQKADIVIANLNPFRGKEPDSGTVWECGYAYGLGKEVYAYMQDTSEYIERFSADEVTIENGNVYDKEGMLVEDFAYPLNLMLSCSLKEIVKGSFEDALKKVAKLSV